MEIKLIEISGFEGCFKALKLPYKLESRSKFETLNCDIVNKSFNDDEYIILKQSTTISFIHKII